MNYIFVFRTSSAGNMGKEDHEKDKSNGHHTIHNDEDHHEPTGSLATNLVLASFLRITT